MILSERVSENVSRCDAATDAVSPANELVEATECRHKHEMKRYGRKEG